MTPAADPQAVGEAAGEGPPRDVGPGESHVGHGDAGSGEQLRELLRSRRVQVRGVDRERVGCVAEHEQAGQEDGESTHEASFAESRESWGDATSDRALRVKKKSETSA